MKQETFMKLVEEQHEYRKSLLGKPEKKRMAGTKDRMINFRRMAKVKNRRPASIPLDLCTKQFIDIVDMVDGIHGKSGNIKYLKDLIADVQNYLDMALVLEIEEKGLV